MRPNSTRRASPMRASCHRRSRRAASCASTPARRCVSKASSTCSRTRHRPPMADTDQAYHDDVAPEGGSPFRPLYDGNILFNGQPIAVVVAESIGGRARRGAPWCASNMRRKRTPPISNASANNAFSLSERHLCPDTRQSRAAMPRRRSPPPRCATKPNTSSRSSITIRWNCTDHRGLAWRRQADGL